MEVQNLWRWREESVAASIFCHHYRYKNTTKIEYCTSGLKKHLNKYHPKILMEFNVCSSHLLLQLGLNDCSNIQKCVKAIYFIQGVIQVQVLSFPSISFGIKSHFLLKDFVAGIRNLMLPRIGFIGCSKDIPRT